MKIEYLKNHPQIIYAIFNKKTEIDGMKVIAPFIDKVVISGLKDFLVRKEEIENHPEFSRWIVDYRVDELYKWIILSKNDPTDN